MIAGKDCVALRQSQWEAQKESERIHKAHGLNTQTKRRMVIRRPVLSFRSVVTKSVSDLNPGPISNRNRERIRYVICSRPSTPTMDIADGNRRPFVEMTFGTSRLNQFAPVLWCVCFARCIF